MRGREGEVAVVASSFRYCFSAEGVSSIRQFIEALARHAGAALLVRLAASQCGGGRKAGFES